MQEASPASLTFISPCATILAGRLIMQLEDYFDFLAPDDIRIKGHRIGIEDVLYEYIFNAKSPDELQRRFPTLTLEQIYATLTYYLHNKEKIDAYLTDWIEFGERMRAEQAKNPPAPMARLRKLDQQKVLAEARAQYDAFER
jgi:uncharacterized protein (DUF433 family)